MVGTRVEPQADASTYIDTGVMFDHLSPEALDLGGRSEALERRRLHVVFFIRQGRLRREDYQLILIYQLLKRYVL